MNVVSFAIVLGVLVAIVLVRVVVRAERVQRDFYLSWRRALFFGLIGLGISAPLVAAGADLEDGCSGMFTYYGGGEGMQSSG